MMSTTPKFGSLSLNADSNGDCSHDFNHHLIFINSVTGFDMNSLKCVVLKSFNIKAKLN